MQFVHHDLTNRKVTLVLDNAEAKELKSIFAAVKSLCAKEPLSFPSNQRKIIPGLANLTHEIAEKQSRDAATKIPLPFTVLLDLSSCLFITKMIRPDTIKKEIGTTPARLATLSEHLLSGYEAQRGMNRAQPRLGYASPIL